MMCTWDPTGRWCCRTDGRSCWSWCRGNCSDDSSASVGVLVASTADFRNGIVLEIDGHLYQMVYFQHVKPGKGGAFVRTKLKNIRTGAVLDRTFNAGERVTDARLERRPIQFSYIDGHFYHFMDQQTFDDIMLTDDLI